MSAAENKKKGAARAVAMAAGAVAFLCLGSLVLASGARAAATLEPVGCFAGPKKEPCKPILPAPKSESEFPEETQLGGLGGMAVNYTGAGGVPKGTVYAISTIQSQGPAVLMFFPAAGGLKFEEAWRITAEPEPYSGCGPFLGENGSGEAEQPCPRRVEAEAQQIDVDVDEETGDVYAYYGPTGAGRKGVVLYNADGSEEITRFGELAPPGETIAESPAKVHGVGNPGGIAVNGAGEVYVADEDFSFHHRLMRFKPKTPGDFSEYEYAAGEDIGAANPHSPRLPVVDAAGHVYVASASTFVEEYDPSNPGNPPLCTYEHKKAGIKALTVNPLTGNVFFASNRIEKGFAKKTVHELGVCNEATHRFEGPKGEEQVAQAEVSPERSDVSGLALDPSRAFEAGRPAGTLYAGEPGAVPAPGNGEGEPGQASLGYVFAPARESPPAILSEAVSQVRTSTARLEARIDPKGFQTHYAFEYETRAQYEANPPADPFEGASEAPLGGATLPGSNVVQSASAPLSGLLPDTEYRFRAVARSEGCPSEPGEVCLVEGEARRLRTYPAVAAGPPDERAYELVSPADKNGGQVLPADPLTASCGGAGCKPGSLAIHYPMQSAPDGDAVAYEGSAFGSGGATGENGYVARRDPNLGWQTVNPTPSLLKSRAPGFRAFSEDLGESVLGPLQPTLSPQVPTGYEELYAQPTTAPFAVRPLIGEATRQRTAGEFKVRYAGASADLSRVFFAANDALTEETASAPAAVDGGASKFNLYEWERETGTLRLVNVTPGGTTAPGASFGAGSAHAVSADGSRVFWSDEAGQVFVREDAEDTTEIPDAGNFLAAATDGSRVLLADGHLYDLEDEATSDLTAGKGGFQGLVGQSDDLTRIYFVDTAALTGAEEACREGVAGEEICEAAQAGEDNLYAWSEGTTKFVATLLGADNSAAFAGDWQALPGNRTAEASPGGEYLAFQSRAQLTGFGNVGPCKFNGETNEPIDSPCPEAFLYDAQNGKLSCPSCNPSGSAPLGRSTLRQIDGDGSLPQPRYLLDSGRLFFDSGDSLSPRDTNEGVEDVYEAEPQGIGGCGRPGGCVALVSAGTESSDSNFLATDPSGADVFFTSRDRLVASDTDELFDLYDAREFGGFPPILPPQPCLGEGCQTPSPAAADPPPSSATFAGPGNAKPAKPRGCPKGKVRRHGRCVKKRRQHKRSLRGQR
jgi:hypothetical protein